MWRNVVFSRNSLDRTAERTLRREPHVRFIPRSTLSVSVASTGRERRSPTAGTPGEQTHREISTRNINGPNHFEAPLGGGTAGHHDNRLYDDAVVTGCAVADESLLGRSVDCGKALAHNYDQWALRVSPPVQPKPVE